MSASRYKVEPTAVKQPGIDYITGTSIGPFIDTGKDITIGDRKFGRIYLSKSTVAEMARELGLIGGHADNNMIQDAYNRGKLDALREELGGDLIAVTTALGRWLSYVNSDLAPSVGAQEDE